MLLSHCFHDEDDVAREFEEVNTRRNGSFNSDVNNYLPDIHNCVIQKLRALCYTINSFVSGHFDCFMNILCYVSLLNTV